MNHPELDIHLRRQGDAPMFAVVIFFRRRDNQGRNGTVRTLWSFPNRWEAKECFDKTLRGYKLLLKGKEILQEEGDKSILEKWQERHPGIDPYITISGDTEAKKGKSYLHGRIRYPLR